MELKSKHSTAADGSSAPPNLKGIQQICVKWKWSHINDQISPARGGLGSHTAKCTGSVRREILFRERKFRCLCPRCEPSSRASRSPGPAETCLRCAEIDMLNLNPSVF